MEPSVPPHLIDQIAAGRCVAFVGAGFSAPAVPAWKALLEGLGEKATLDDDTRAWLGELAGIPFDAILTTNFDHFLVGDVPGPDAYQRILRDPPHRWWEPRFWEGEAGAPVLKLHGEVGPVGDDVVFTQRDYRERLYSSAAYMTFLRSLFATSTVLFLGVSFTDAYLNELRSEVLAMLDHRSDDAPVAYAVLPDVKPHQQRYLAHHEGLGALSYDTAGGTDWSGFENVLRQLHDATNPRALLGHAITGRRILWADSDPDDTSYGARLLADAAAARGASTRVDLTRSLEESLDSLRADPADLVIADWPLAEPLLVAMHAEDLRAPVVVFARGGPPDRRRALALGATDALTEWADLFREIERVLGSRLTPRTSTDGLG
ncbi:MAG: SIR2 family protein [Nocardioides sp.]